MAALPRFAVVTGTMGTSVVRTFDEVGTCAECMSC